MVLQEEFKQKARSFLNKHYERISIGVRFSLLFHLGLVILSVVAWPRLSEIELPEPEPLSIMIVASEEPPAAKPKERSDVTAVGFIQAPPLLDEFDREKRQNKFNPGRLAALLDKLPDEKNQNPALPKQELTIRDIDAIKVQMRRCWTIPAGAANAHKLVVKIKVFLDVDGNMITPPKVLTRARGRFFRIAVENALRALSRCQPFKMPPEKYEVWREMVLIFNPSEMLEGKKTEG